MKWSEYLEPAGRVVVPSGGQQLAAGPGWRDERDAQVASVTVLQGDHQLHVLELLDSRGGQRACGRVRAENEAAGRGYRPDGQGTGDEDSRNNGHPEGCVLPFILQCRI